MSAARLRGDLQRATQRLAADPGHEVCRRISRPQALLRRVNTPETFLLYAADGRIVSHRDRRARPCC